jgi:putative DNA primase/helicase
MTDAPDTVNLDRQTPLNSAFAFIEINYTSDNKPTLHHYCDQFYGWTGTHYAKIDNNTIRSQVYFFMDSANQITGTGLSLPFAPNSRRVTEVLDALKAAINLDSSNSAPSWLNANNSPPPSDIVAFKNGLLDLPSRKLLNHSPDFFSFAALPFSYDQNAPEPREWLLFLKSIFENDQEAIGTLHEIMGYLLTFDTRQQKIFLILGPKRSGKGTIAKVIKGLLGPSNVVWPTLAGLGSNFGLAPLIDKQLAIISDARLNGRADQQMLVERFLSMSGEDSQTIDRKYLEPWTGSLRTRVLILTNELPRLADASGALASRFVTLVLKNSFYGREDLGLAERLLAELPSICNLALDGRDRLERRGYFKAPASSTEVAQELEDLVSPISIFVRERCIVGPWHRVEVSKLFSAWQAWCMTQGRDKPGTAQSFGRDLRAFIPRLTVSQLRNGSERDRYYVGIGLKG